mmetsp:Transcript_25229/g.49302  ORF Transcript_25229/g.49302 Transcript_25229/m.49302 type:complete len:103 (-) Transcript_25229:335-643(-)
MNHMMNTPLHCSKSPTFSSSHIHAVPPPGLFCPPFHTHSHTCTHTHTHTHREREREKEALFFTDTAGISYARTFAIPQHKKRWACNDSILFLHGQQVTQNAH